MSQEKRDYTKKHLKEHLSEAGPPKRDNLLQASIVLRDIIEAEGMNLSERAVEKLDAIATMLQEASKHDEL